MRYFIAPFIRTVDDIRGAGNITSGKHGFLRRTGKGSFLTARIVNFIDIVNTGLVAGNQHLFIIVRDITAKYIGTFIKLVDAVLLYLPDRVLFSYRVGIRVARI